MGILLSVFMLSELEMRAEKQRAEGFLATVYLYEMYVCPISSFVCVSFALEIPILSIPETFMSDYWAYDIKDDKEEQCN